MPDQERRLRRLAAHQGLALQKSRSRNFTVDNYGGYRIVDSYRNWLVAGDRFDPTLDDVEGFLTAERFRRRAGVSRCTGSAVPPVIEQDAPGPCPRSRSVARLQGGARTRRLLR